MVTQSADPTKIGDRVEAATETTPLLTVPESGIKYDSQMGGPIPSEANGHETSDTNARDETKDGEKPMPYTQVCLLCYVSLAEPVAFFAIFPFINEMIQRTGHMNEKDVGFWGGLIESLFSLVQMVLMIFYGRASDRMGRKPVLVFSLTGIALATALFGMSRTLWQMIVTRCLAGVFAGSVVTVRTMLSEITTKETQGKAFSYYMFVRNAGIFIGPLIGMFLKGLSAYFVVTNDLAQVEGLPTRPNNSQKFSVACRSGKTIHTP